MSISYRKTRGGCRGNVGEQINHKTRMTRPPGGGAGPAGAALTYLIEYCLISNDQLLGRSLPVPGSGTRNSLVHPVR